MVHNNTNVLTAQRKLQTIFHHANKLEVNREHISNLKSAKRLYMISDKKYNNSFLSSKLRPLITGILSVSLIIVIYTEIYTHQGFSRAWLQWHNEDVYEAMCTIPMPVQLLGVFQPPQDCGTCRGVNHVERVANISPSTFERRFLRSGTPVVVTDATSKWSVPHVCGLELLRRLLLHASATCLGDECSLQALEAAAAAALRVNVTAQRPWQNDMAWPECGQSDGCCQRMASVLRRHYSRPYFLAAIPAAEEVAELRAEECISVANPTSKHVEGQQQRRKRRGVWWHAQLRGRSAWVLRPPLECTYQCETQLELELAPGEILVVDDRRWSYESWPVSEDICIKLSSQLAP